MKKLLDFLPALAVMLVFAFCGGPSVHAQSGPAGINPANFIIGIQTGADTSSSTATIGDATHVTWVCGIAVTGLGATAATNVAVSVGPITNTAGVGVNLNFEYAFTASATTINVPLQQVFTPCLPVAGVATLTVPGAAGNTSTLLNIWGYKQ